MYAFKEFTMSEGQIGCKTSYGVGNMLPYRCIGEGQGDRHAAPCFSALGRHQQVAPLSVRVGGYPFHPGSLSLNLWTDAQFYELSAYKPVEIKGVEYPCGGIGVVVADVL